MVAIAGVRSTSQPTALALLLRWCGKMDTLAGSWQLAWRNPSHRYKTVFLGTAYVILDIGGFYAKEDCYRPVFYAHHRMCTKAGFGTDNARSGTGNERSTATNVWTNRVPVFGRCVGKHVVCRLLKYCGRKDRRWADNICWVYRFTARCHRPIFYVYFHLFYWDDRSTARRHSYLRWYHGYVFHDSRPHSSIGPRWIRVLGTSWYSCSVFLGVKKTVPVKLRPLLLDPLSPTFIPLDCLIRQSTGTG